MDFEEKEETKVRGRSRKRQRNSKRSISTPPTTTLTESSTHTIVKSKKLIVNTAKRALHKAEDELRQLSIENSRFSNDEIQLLEMISDKMTNNIEFSSHVQQFVFLTSRINEQRQKLDEEEPLLQEMEFCINRIQGLQNSGYIPPRRAHTVDGEDRGVVSVFLRQWGLLK